MKKMIFAHITLALLATLFLSQINQSSAQESKNSSPVKSGEFSKAPTYIKSNSLEIRHNERIFTYNERVEVTQNDLRMTSQKLVGTYDQNNKIQEMIATGDVVVTRGLGIRAAGGRAVYKAGEDKVTLSESPELMQNGSILIADRVILLLNENRAFAEGDVKVKVLQSSAATDAKDVLKK